MYKTSFQHSLRSQKVNIEKNKLVESWWDHYGTTFPYVAKQDLKWTRKSGHWAQFPTQGVLTPSLLARLWSLALYSILRRCSPDTPDMWSYIWRNMEYVMPTCHCTLDFCSTVVDHLTTWSHLVPADQWRSKFYYSQHHSQRHNAHQLVYGTKNHSFFCEGTKLHVQMTQQ